MIRTKILHGKVDILLIDGLPEDAIIGIAKHGGFVYRIPVLLGEPLRYIIDLPPGNWQPVNWLDKINENEAKELIVDDLAFNHSTRETYYLYKNYITGNWLYSAKESLLSLVESQVKVKNIKRKCQCRMFTEQFEKCLFINKDVTSCRIFEEWQAEESKVWKNIYLLKYIN